MTLKEAFPSVGAPPKESAPAKTDVVNEKAVKMLRQIRDHFSDGLWTQGHLSRRRASGRVEYCTIGAIHHFGDGYGWMARRRAKKLIKEANGLTSTMSIMTWNDRRSRYSVIKGIDRAVALGERRYE